MTKTTPMPEIQRRTIPRGTTFSRPLCPCAWTLGELSPVHPSWGGSTKFGSGMDESILGLRSLVRCRAGNPRSLSPVVLTQYACDIKARFTIGWNPMPSIHRPRSCIVGRQSETDILVKAREQLVQVSRSSSDILLWHKRVLDPERSSGGRHQLHQPSSAHAGHSPSMATGLRIDQRSKQIHIDMVKQPRIGQQTPDRPWYAMIDGQIRRCHHRRRLYFFNQPNRGDLYLEVTGTPRGWRQIVRGCINSDLPGVLLGLVPGAFQIEAILEDDMFLSRQEHRKHGRNRREQL